MFEIIPAVDILQGKCVRLKQGRYDKQTIYYEDPVEAAKHWQDKGAKRLHVVDLDGAKTGTPENIEILKKIISELEIPVQTSLLWVPTGIQGYSSLCLVEQPSMSCRT